MIEENILLSGSGLVFRVRNEKILNQNICCGYSKKRPNETVLEHPKHVKTDVSENIYIFTLKNSGDLSAFGPKRTIDLPKISIIYFFFMFIWLRSVHVHMMTFGSRSKSALVQINKHFERKIKRGSYMSAHGLLNL